MDKPAEREVGRGTLTANGQISRSPIDGAPTNFSNGTKSIALIAAAEWFTQVQSGGGGSSAALATRALLAATPSSQPAVLLAEAGREGLFVFDNSNLSALVSADTRQAVYVAPTSAPTGASGAWVRKREGDHLHIDWFGPNGDGATDDTAAFVALRTLAGALSRDAASGLRKGPEIRLGAKTYFLASSFDCKGFTATWRGSGGGFNFFGNTGTTTIKLATGKTWYFQRADTEGASTGNSIPFGCDGSVFYDIAWQGPGKGVGSASVARMRAKVSLYNCRFTDGGGYGLEISATAGGGTALEGNANGWLIVGGAAGNNGKSGLGIGVNGASADVNAGKCDAMSFIGNAEFGFVDLSFLGSLFVAIHSEANGLATAGGANYNGNIYFPVAGQEAGASTNPPSGTTADNAYWYYGGAGTSAYFATWTNGATFVAGGAFRTGNAPIKLDGCYSESGQGYAQLGPGTLWDSGTNGSGNKGGTRPFAASGNLTLAAGGFRSYDPGSTLETLFGGSGDIFKVSGGALANSFRGFAAGKDLYTAIGGADADRDSLWTGPTTSYTFGRAASAGYGYRAFAKPAIGNGTYDFDQARVFQVATATPSSGDRARGEVIFPRDPSAAGKVLSRCIAGHATNGGTWEDIYGLSASAATIATSGSAADLTAGTVPAARMPAHTGDVTSAAGSVGLTIANGAVGYAKIQNVSAASRLLGRASAGAGVVEEIGLGGGLTISGSNLTLGAITPTSVAATGGITSAGGAVGYATGAGGTVTQATSKSNGVTINKASGQITTHNASLAAAAAVSFTVTNSAVAATDTINLNLASGNATAGSYRYWVEGIASGSFKIVIENRSGGALAETLVFTFAALKAVAA